MFLRSCSALLGLSLSSLMMASAAYSNSVHRSGIYEVIEVDYENAPSTTVEYIHDHLGNRRKIKAHNKETLRKFKTGDKIGITGSESSSEMLVESAEFSESQASSVDYMASETIEKKVLSVLVDFSDYPSHATASSLKPIQDNAIKMYNETTFGKIHLNFDANNNGVRDVYRVKISDATTVGCSYEAYSGWRTQVMNNLASRGIKTDVYNNMVLYLPKEVSCTWAGLGHIGSLRSGTSWLLTAWIKNESSATPRTTIHELGHNAGLRHAGKDADNNNIAETEYGDTSCFMGSALRSTNGPHSVALGAYEDHSHSVEEMVDSKKVFTITASDIHPDLTSSPHIVKVLKNVVSSTKKNYYFLSYRRGVGSFDVNLASTYKTGVSIHTQAGEGAPTLYVKTLIPGETFTDSANGVSITMIDKSYDGSSIDVSVSQINNVICTKFIPTLSLSNTMMDFPTHATAQTKVTVRNNNSNGCPASTFNLGAATSGSNLSVTTSISSVLLAAGESVDVDVSLKSNAFYGPYKVTFSAQELSGVSAVKEMDVNIQAVIPKAPANLSLSVASPNIVVSWGASTSPSIAKYQVFRKLEGEATFSLAGSVSTTSFSQTLPTKRATYYVNAVDVAGLVSPNTLEQNYTPSSTISAPSGLSTSIAYPNITLKWKAPSTSTAGVSHYRIYRRNADVSTYSMVGTSTTLSYTETLPKVKVYYKIKAVDVYGKLSAYSGYVTYTPATLAAPTNLALSIVKPNLTLKWSAAVSSVGVQYYKVYRKLSSESLYKARGTVTTLSFTETIPLQSAIYYVKVYDVHGNYKTSLKVTFQK